LISQLFWYAFTNDLIKQYQVRNIQTLNFRPISGPITNPLMGWAPWATIAESQQPHTLVYADLTWREFEPRPGVYDFDAFEKKHQFDRWRAENKRVVFRFICDKPGAEKHMDIPDWLFDAIHGSGDRYNNAYGQGFSPDYTHPQLIQFHKKAIQALGDRYGKDDFFAYIELGSLGHWGEWHIKVDSGIRRLPPEKIRDIYVIHYIEAFPNTFLLMRRPFTIARQYRLGLYNDMTGSFESTNEWLNWIAKGGEYDQTAEMNALAPMPNAWWTAPVGGEQASNMSNDELYRKNVDQTIALLEKSHTTFIGPNSPYEMDHSRSLQSGYDRVLERIGYRIYIKQVQMPWSIHIGKKINISVTFANDGVAPMYYNWPAKFYLYNENGKISKIYPAELDLRKILPGKAYKISFSLPLDRLKQGTYTVGFAIMDPKTNQPAVKLAMENPRNDRIQELGSFYINAVTGMLSR